ncbi:M28 family peptidase [Marilutibacter aestuarii]|uniref:Carboxypeptidase Q n=1 Tax=Marilutibacter aestuarii TaxID=1706195 RepID=A0A508A811_9GAMM|nr:M28 family peptidase [Lysobacter aestuarii]TQD45557.1 M28 family peptidase [Lysobacter aestuarii]
MHKTLLALATALLLSSTVATGPVLAGESETRIGVEAHEVVPGLRDAALRSDLAYRVVESLTTEVGPRLAGSEADARAVAWAEAKFHELGFDKVWKEPVTFPKWERRSEHARVLGANAQPLTITALGGSPGGTVEGEVVRFADLAALEAAPAGSLAGKIAFVDYRMERARDGAGYGPGSRVRSRGPSAAIRAGAAGYVMRSAGTDSHRNPHTGITRFDEGLQPIPSAALSVPDADQLARLVARGTTRLQLALDCGWTGTATSYNVIGQINGSERPEEVVVIGGHLDSWDLGTGAVDDGAGVGITMAAGALIGQLPAPPARSIRVVAFANEEQGLYGGKAYAEAHKDEVGLHVIGAESDFGAGRIYGYSSSAPAYAEPADKAIAEALAPLGIVHMPGEGGPGPDIGPMAANGVAWARLAQDGTDYFDLHHTPDDTFDKIDPEALAQNVAAYAVFAYLAASNEVQHGFGSAPRDTPPAED